MHRIKAALLLVGLAGCASSGQPGVEPVEVYFAPGEVPCQYEVAGQVRGEVQAQGSFQWRQRTRSVLGREGARLGFDAVLVDTTGETARVVRTEGPRTSVPRATVVGDGLRFLQADCRSLG